MNAIFICIAVGIYWIMKYEEHQTKGLNTTDAELNASILADLQQIQDDEFHNTLNSLFNKVTMRLIPYICVIYIIYHL